jgi:hypothetical protein
MPSATAIAIKRCYGGEIEKIGCLDQQSRKYGKMFLNKDKYGLFVLGARPRHNEERKASVIEMLAP